MTTRSEVILRVVIEQEMCRLYSKLLILTRRRMYLGT